MHLFKRKISSRIFTFYEEPIRAELYSFGRMEKCAEEMALKQTVTKGDLSEAKLSLRVSENEDILIKSYRLIIETARREKFITPAAEWIIDNFYIVEEQLKDIKDHLPPEYYKELPKLSSGHLLGFPRVYSIAWTFVAHTDSFFNPELLKVFINSYQKVMPLTIGEIWAISISLRIVLIENLRRLCISIVGSQLARDKADYIADELLGLDNHKERSIDKIIKNIKDLPLSKGFVVQIIQRLRFQEGEGKKILTWLDTYLSSKGLIGDQIVQEEHNTQTAANVTVRNIINSMRLISSVDWRDFFEEVSLVNGKLNEHQVYGLMDFATRDNYRHSLEELARGSELSELEIAAALVKKIEDKRNNVKSLKNEKHLDLGFYLISSGRYEFEKEIGFKVKFKNYFLRWYIAHRELIYLGSIFILTFSFSWICIKESSSVNFISFYLLGLLGLFPASELAITIINRLTMYVLAPRHLPRLDFSKKIPPEFKTFIVIPTMLVGADDIVNQVDQLEVHYLTNPDDSVYFALLSDWKDSISEHVISDADLLSIATDQINHLNKKYGKSSLGKNRFYIFHRYRKWNESEQKWIGWERKRGKIQEFNKFLRGDKNTSFIMSDINPHDIPSDIVYVITLDADTKLSKGAIAQLVGTCAHPLNHPILDSKLNRVMDGYGILQPRVTPLLPANKDCTFFQRLSSGVCGIDPYASAVSNVYQDLFGEGSYTGKGIYNVDFFSQVMKERTPENRLLSHDLYEGNFARCGLVSDIEFFEDFPSHFEVSSARNHRWIRGDWQLIPWILGREGNSISIIGRWKMIDNLRRSLLAPVISILFCLMFFLTKVNILPWVILCTLSISFPHFLPFLENFFYYHKKNSLKIKFKSICEELFMGVSHFIFNFIFIPYHSWVSLDAVIRTFVRLGFTKKKLLEWTTSSQVKFNSNITVTSFIERMWIMQLVLFGIGAFVFWIRPDHWEVLAVMLLVWMTSPFVAWRISLSPIRNENIQLCTEDIFFLRNNARRIWHFFSTFVTPEENYLPPDNFQEIPKPTIAHRSSPTNFGLYLMSIITARDFGWIGLVEMIERLELTIKTMQELPRYNGHFYNWYETSTGRALEPRYISSVDNGNLAGHLFAVAQSCEEMASKVLDPTYCSSMVLFGIQDGIRLLEEAFLEQTDFLTSSILNDLIKLLSMPFPKDSNQEAFWDLLSSKSSFLLEQIKFYGGKKHEDEINEIHEWANAIAGEIKSHARDYYELILNNAANINGTKNKLDSLAANCRELVYDMDFSFLYNPIRKLFSIGYRMSDSSLDDSYYDLLASEARLLSFVAIAKGDVPVEHWFRLGRSLSYVEKGAVLISWSGSMFEYLMPSLVMKTPASSLLEQTCRLSIKKQIKYANKKSIPWGMSESGYNARDLHLTYQYSNFGIPELAFKRGLGKDLVVAPYATMLAGMYDLINAIDNLRRISKLNAGGLFGYYESIDFTKTRVQGNQKFSIVKTYMAHHQGMSLVAISNIINRGLMSERFHREPIIQASELLLQERIPRNITITKTRVEKVAIDYVHESNESFVRQYFSPHHRVPKTQVLSNGSYSVMITSAGSGYSRFNNLSLTRWREDVTRDNWGSYIYLRDIYMNKIWSAGYRPSCVEADKYEVIFTEDRAKIIREDNLITSCLEVFVSPENSAEIRRVGLTNNSSEVRVVELTTYLEVVLNNEGADVAHSVFSNLFVQTEYISDTKTLLATRRRRSSLDDILWMAQTVSVDENGVGEVEYETDRARFIGRGRSIENPIALENKKLSNTVGNVIDPILSIRTRVRIEPGTTATVTFSTIIASGKDEILRLAEKFNESSSYERNSNLVWTEAQVKLHYLGIEHSEANLFQQLANRLIFLDSTLRASSEVLRRNTKNVTGLWAHGISGDNPIILVYIDNVEQRNLVRQLLRAHEYFGTKCFAVDLIIVNEKVSSYTQELHSVLESLIVSSTLVSSSYLPKYKGKVFLLRSDIMSESDLDLLQTAARVIFNGCQGGLAEQVKREVRKIDKGFSFLDIKMAENLNLESHLNIPPLVFYNGIGGFTNLGYEYIIHLKKDNCTPAPWVNIVANSEFGFQVSESGAGSTWAKNSRENQITPWFNDPVSDPIAECFYIYDKENKELWCPTISPIRVKNSEYIIRHGQGYSQFEHCYVGIHCVLTQFVHADLSVKISKIVLKNERNVKRNIVITSYVEWVLGFSRGKLFQFLIADYDKKSKSLLCHNPWNQEFGSCLSFASFIGGNDEWTSNRKEFIGRNGNLNKPKGLITNRKLSRSIGAGEDACAAIQKNITIDAGKEVTIIFILGQADNKIKVQELIENLNKQDFDNVFNDVITGWKNILEKIQVETPDLATDIMLNRWLLYQTIVCRLWSRSAFYQAGGAYGFRDQLQDSMAVVWVKPEVTRLQILQAASRQFIEGDVQHWWHIPSGKGVRTHFSDDLLWMPFVVSYYLSRTNDYSILDEEIFFLKGPLLKQTEEDSFYIPEISTEKGSLYEHCARALDCSLKVGIHGLPLIGGGDWNDGMNRVGHEGKGESVWLAWFLMSNLREFLKIAEERGENLRATNWQHHLDQLKISIEEQAWDGDWYRRAFYDDGTSMGSKNNIECKIDSLTQSWGVISKSADLKRSEHAMEFVEKYLINNYEKLILLFTPPFDKTPLDPGYIKGYIPGVRENGGQYTHAAIWCVLAYVGLDNGKRATELFSMLNPINHSLSYEEAFRYKVEPYVIAADIYSEPPHAGRGGWTWYTGSSGWMYTTGIEAILGFKLSGDNLRIDPHIHPDWKSYKIIYRYLETMYEIKVKNPNGLSFGLKKIFFDGRLVEKNKTMIKLIDDKIYHKIEIELY